MIALNNNRYLIIIVINSDFMAETRNTVQMQKILDYLIKVKSHPNAETVYVNVKNAVPSITRATVYRNLHKLADEGKICRLEINGEYKFDADCSVHKHCVCKSCGKIFDYYDKHLSEKMLRDFKSKDFNPVSVNLIYFGYCTKCSKRRK